MLQLHLSDQQFYCLLLGLKRYAEPMIRYDTQYSAHDTIHSAIHFNDLPLLAEKQRLVMTACDQEHRTPHAPYWLRTSCAVMMYSSYNNGGLLGVFQVQCIWAKFTRFIWIYWLLMWYFLVLSNFGKCYKCTVKYRYLLLRITIHIGAPVSAVCRCIVSALPTMVPLILEVWHYLQI